MPTQTTADRMSRVRAKARGAKRRVPAATKLLGAIRMHCIECFGGERGQVEKCTDRECRLYPFRMGVGGFRPGACYDLNGGEGHLSL
jgi:hypothetical protein